MSSPPPYNSGVPHSNPDTRQLPAGWITQFDSNYKAWFYVNTQANPPVTVWTHPLGPPPAAPPAQYAPPAGPPPVNTSTHPGYGNDRNHGQYGQGDYYSGGYAQHQQPQHGGYGPQGGYGGPPPQGYGGHNQGGYGGEYDHGSAHGGSNSGGKGLLGGLFGGKHGKHDGGDEHGGKHGKHGKHGSDDGHGGKHGKHHSWDGHGAVPVYGQPPPQQVVYVQQPAKKSGGMGAGAGLAIGAGAGLLGGLLVADAVEDAFDDGGFGDDMGGDW